MIAYYTYIVRDKDTGGVRYLVSDKDNAYSISLQLNLINGLNTDVEKVESSKLTPSQTELVDSKMNYIIDDDTYIDCRL